jgi:hypothetical protein
VNSEEAIRDILEYLVAHPDAKDGIEGIRQWWKPQGKPQRRQSEIQRALDFLVKKKWIVVRELSRAHKVYGVDRQHIAEIQEFLLKS